MHESRVRFRLMNDAVASPAPNHDERPSPPLASLRRRAIAGTIWATAARTFASGGSVLRYLIFARLLRPIDFGIVGSATFCEMLLLALSDPSFDSALVAQGESITSYRDTVWTTMLLRSSLIAVILIAAAKPLAVFFLIPRQYSVFYAMGLLGFISGLRSPASTAMIARELEFQISTVLNVAELVTSILAGVITIHYSGDWWGLVAAMYAGHLARSTLTYWFFPYFPRLRLDLKLAKKMFGFGRWITLRHLTEYATRNLDTLIVGHLLGAPALGEYQMARRFGELPTTELGGSASMVLFPLTARLKGDPRVPKRFLNYGSAAIVGVGALFATAVLTRGGLLIRVVFGAKWLGALPPLEILCFYGIFSALGMLGKSALDGSNHPESSFYAGLASLSVMAALIYPCTSRWSTFGAGLAASLASAAALPVIYLLYVKINKVLTPAVGAAE